MRKLVSIFILALLANVAEAQTVSKTINVTTAGTLSTLLTSTEKTSITDLTVTGNIDARDVKCMRDEITKLAVLDMSEVSIMAYTGTQGPDYNFYIVYPVNEMPGASFFQKASLKTIKLPFSITSIGPVAFKSCSELTGNLTIPDSVTSIGLQAFYDCRKLTGDLVIPNSVNSIGDFAFYDCGFTGNLSIGNSLTTIGRYAFYGCVGFKGDLVIPNSVTSIGGSAFRGCCGFTSVSISTSVKSLESQIFFDCKGFTFVNIPESVTFIGENAFYGCSGLNSINIPKSVSNIGTNPATCEINVDENNPYYSSIEGVLYDKNKINLILCPISITGSYNIPSSVVSIGNNDLLLLAYGTIERHAFSGCKGLTSVIIPPSVTTIGNSAFENCSALTKITIARAVPPTIYPTTFSTINKETCEVIVPVGFISDYRTTDYWSDFLQFSESDFTNSIADQSNTLVKIYTTQSEIVVEGTSPGENVTVYTIGGVQLQNVQSQGKRIVISAPHGATYLVKTASKTVKVALYNDPRLWRVGATLVVALPVLIERAIIPPITQTDSFPLCE